MSELPGLPRRPYPVLLPEPGGFEKAIGRARARRRRQVLEATAMLGVAALFAGGLALRPAPDQSLGIAEQPDRPGDSRIYEYEPDDVRTEPYPTGTAAPGAGPQQPVSGGGGNVRPTTAPRDVPDPVKKPPAVAPTVGRSVKYAAVRRAETLERDCRTSGETQWCIRASVAPVEDVANRYTLTVVVCRMLGDDPDLSFPNAQYVDYEILLKDEIRWTWSKNQTFPPGERSLEVNQGECVAWDTRWDADDEEGRLVHRSIEDGAGQYTLRVRSTATELAGRAASVPFNVE